MSFTRYLYQSRDFTSFEWVSILEATKRVLDNASAAGIVICGGNGTGAPVADKDSIWLNGNEAEGLDHETFMLSRDKPAQPSYRRGELEYFSFCKTARKPYDVVVKAILEASAKIAPSAIRVSSD